MSCDPIVFELSDAERAQLRQEARGGSLDLRAQEIVRLYLQRERIYAQVRERRRQRREAVKAAAR